MADRQNPRSDVRWRRGLLLPIVLLIVLLVVWFITETRIPLPSVFQLQPKYESYVSKESHVESYVSRAQRLKQYYDSTLQPLVYKNQQANLEAIERCLARIDDAFNRYRNGITPFTKDITSFGTQAGILSRMPGDWLHEDDRVYKYVHAIFEKHIFTERQLNDDLKSSLDTLRGDIHANRSQLLASVRLAVSESDFADLPVPDHRAFDEQVNSQMQELLSTIGRDTLAFALMTTASWGITELIAEHIIKRVVAAKAKKYAAHATANVAATAGSAAAGARGGSLGGPLGTVIGMGIGLVIGIILDFWTADNFKATLEAELNQYLNDLHDGIINGVKEEPGLRAVLQNFFTHYNNAQDDTLRRILLGGSR